MVKLIGAYKQNSSSYMMYEWAEGGNLREFWDDNRNWALNGAIVQWSFKQMLGLATALRMWHKYYPHSHKVGWHGDLKPENILHFRDDSRGVFKIDDFGHARLHALPTHTRNTVSVSLIDSIRYRPPEVQLGRTQAASRSYDMWSIGCVYLEWIIWLCYGREVLYKFQKQVFSDNIDGFFTQKDEGWIVHPIVERWMDHMQNTCSGAIRQLLLFIRGGLLVAATQESVTRSAKLMALDSARASIDDLCQTLEAISELSERNSNYLYDPNVVMYTPEFQDVHQSRKHIPWTPTSQLYPQKKARTSLRRQLNHQIGNNNRYMTPTSVDVWNQEPDNAFAKSVFGTLRRTEISLLAPMHPVSTSLCGNCSSNENSLLSQRPFSISYQKSKVSQSDCIVCAILHDKMADMPGEDCGKAVMREESSLITTTGNLPVFSIIAGPTHGMLKR
jgi:serine/threonine protein kinase